MLSSAGHEAVESQDGVEALAFLRTGGFDAVITDVLMPRMDGYSLCYEIRKSDVLRDIPVVVYSSSFSSAEDEKLARRAGSDEYVRKPASPATILDAFERILRTSGQERVLAAGPGAELEILKLYSEGLIRKLESQNVDLEATHERSGPRTRSSRASERHLRLLLDSTAEGIYGLDLDCRLTFSNAAGVALLAVTTHKTCSAKTPRSSWARIPRDPSARGRTAGSMRRKDSALSRAREVRCLHDSGGRRPHTSEEEVWRADGTSFPGSTDPTPCVRTASWSAPS